MSKIKAEKFVDAAVEQPAAAVAQSATATQQKMAEQFLTAGKTHVDSFVRLSSETAEKVMAASKERMEKSVRSYDEINSFNKQTVEALVGASQAAARHFEALNAEVLAFSKAQIEESITASKTIMTAKTLQELLDAQSKYVKSMIDGSLAQSTKMGEMVTRMAQESLEPINAQVQAAVEKFAKPLAA